MTKFEDISAGEYFSDYNDDLWLCVGTFYIKRSDGTYVKRNAIKLPYSDEIDFDTELWNDEEETNPVDKDIVWRYIWMPDNLNGKIVNGKVYEERDKQ